MLVIFQQTLDAGRIGIAAQGLGIAQVSKCIKNYYIVLRGVQFKHTDFYVMLIILTKLTLP